MPIPMAIRTTTPLSKLFFMLSPIEIYYQELSIPLRRDCPGAVAMQSEHAQDKNWNKLWIATNQLRYRVLRRGIQQVVCTQVICDAS